MHHFCFVHAQLGVKRGSSENEHACARIHIVLMYIALGNTKKPGSICSFVFSLFLAYMPKLYS